MASSGCARCTRPMGWPRSKWTPCAPRAQALQLALPGSAQRRDAQHLARIDLVGVGQHWPVGLENDVVLVALALAVLALGNRPQRVAFDDRVELRLRSGGGRLDVVLHGLHPDS